MVRAQALPSAVSATRTDSAAKSGSSSAREKAARAVAALSYHAEGHVFAAKVADLWCACFREQGRKGYAFVFVGGGVVAFGGHFGAGHGFEVGQRQVQFLLYGAFD